MLQLLSQECAFAQLSHAMHWQCGHRHEQLNLAVNPAKDKHEQLLFSGFQWLVKIYCQLVGRHFTCKQNTQSATLFVAHHQSVVNDTLYQTSQ